MRKVLPLLVSILLFSNYCVAQYPFNSSGGSSTVLKPLETGAFIGYNLGKSEATFLFNKIKEESSVINVEDETGFPEFGDFKSNSWKVDFLINDNRNNIVAGGEFNPGLSITYSKVENFEDKDDFYQFLTFGYRIKENNFARIENFGVVGDSIFIDEKVTQNFIAAVGVNWFPEGKKSKSKFVLGAGLNIVGNLNSPGVIKAQDVILNSTNANNGSIQKSKTAFFTDADHFFKVQPRLDLAWTPFLIRESKKIMNGRKHKEQHEVGPRLGFLSSVTADLNIQMKNSYNISIGPSLHQKNHTDQVLTAILFEFQDFTDETREKEFKDIFSINFYVGLPIGFKGIK